jgi:hypothetical protein
LRDSCSLDITIEYDPANTGHEAVRAAHAAGTLYYFTLVLPDAGTAQWALSGYITSFNIPTMSVNGSLKATIGFKAITADTFTQ